MLKHLVLVCHTETWWRDGSWQGFETVLEGLLGALDGAAQGDRIPRITFCLSPEAIDDKAAFFRKQAARGHEIGIHTHLPGAHRNGHRYDGEYAYRVDAAGRLNQDLTAAALRARCEAAGLGRAGTHAGGMFTFRDTTAAVLADAGLRVDCSLLPGCLGRHRATGDFLLCDNRARTCPAAYRLHPEDHCLAGNSPVVELPVWGNLSLREDRQRVLVCREESLRAAAPMSGIWEAMRRESDRDFASLPPAGRHEEGRPEIVQLFFHYWDFMRPDGTTDPAGLAAVGSFLKAWRSSEVCGFATADEGASAWAAATLA